MSKPSSPLPATPPHGVEAPSPEASAGRGSGAGCRPLFGDVETQGFSFRWHDFRTDQDTDWATAFQRGSLDLCLNLDGQATLSDTRETIELRPRTSAFYFHGDPPLTARRRANEQHRFVTVGFAGEFLRQHLRQEACHLHPSVRSVLLDATRRSVVSAPEPMRVGVLHLVESLQRCPVFKPAQEMWFRCKALELAAQSFFCPAEGELFCTRQQRAACERAARVREILMDRLADPPPLEDLGRLVGCSPCYLSRQFSEATGLTIQQFLRQARLDRAAHLLRSGTHNVTEAALEVGYNSLSHFTIAFREAFGCCPGLYPIDSALQPARPPTPRRPAISPGP